MAILAALAGFVVGALAVMVVRRRGGQRRVVADDVEPAPLPQGVASVLAVLPSSAGVSPE